MEKFMLKYKNETFIEKLAKILNNPIVIIIIVVIVCSIIKYFTSEKITEPTNTNKTIYTQPQPTEKSQPEENNTNPSDEQTLKINPVSEFDYLSKADIYKIRTSYVKKSLFATPNYVPNAEVFGQIQDVKPWWGMVSMCTQQGEDVNKHKDGPSEESRFINNPNLLVALIPSLRYYYPLNDPFCNDSNFDLIPTKLTLNKRTNTITATYKADDQFMKQIGDSPLMLILIGYNARDFGYNWMLLRKKGNIEFNHTAGFFDSTDVVVTDINDFIHTGGSCGIEGGCNNGSPYRQDHEFRILDLPAYMVISLWKKKPT